MKFSRSPYYIWILHVAMWLILLSILTIVFHGKVIYGLPHAFFLVTSIYHIGLFYFNTYVLYPRLITKKKWPLYLISISLIIATSYFVKIYILQNETGFRLTPDNKRIIFFSVLPLLAASIIFRLINDRVQMEKVEKEAIAERLDAELKFLRSQVNPHFLFNVLTNMVSLARKKSDLLEPSLIKLAELQRYMLYDLKDKKVIIEKELEQLENYIALQQLRFGQDIQIQLTIVNECPGCRIEPMLLIPFVENAYKHGTGPAGKPYIHINIAVTNDQLDLLISNNFEAKTKSVNSGIGLINVKNRLRLLYPGKHQLLIANKEGVFSVHLKLNLL
jgi:two-component system LytT family sensor kinase